MGGLARLGDVALEGNQSKTGVFDVGFDGLAPLELRKELSQALRRDTQTRVPNADPDLLLRSLFACKCNCSNNAAMLYGIEEQVD
jgi:hypothetical protein